MAFPSIVALWPISSLLLDRLNLIPPFLSILVPPDSIFHWSIVYFSYNQATFPEHLCFPNPSVFMLAESCLVVWW